ncbi:hypothetical protein D3C75_557820 [compost metagenome]
MEPPDQQGIPLLQQFPVLAAAHFPPEHLLLPFLQNGLELLLLQIPDRIMKPLHPIVQLGYGYEACRLIGRLLQLGDGLLQLRPAYRLEQVLLHTIGHTLAGILEIPVAGNHHNLDFAVHSGEPPAQLQPVHPGHPDIGKQIIGLILLHESQRFLTVRCQADVRPRPDNLADHNRKTFSDNRLVVHDDDFSHAGSPLLLVQTCSAVPLFSWRSLPQSTGLA